MNTELDQTANEALRALIDNAASTKEFILAELPEVVQQLLMWKTAESIADCVIALAFVGVPLFIVRWQWVNGEEHIKHSIVKETDGAIYLVNAVLILPLLIGTLKYCNLTWLQIWLAPKVYLLEYAADLVK